MSGAPTSVGRIAALLRTFEFDPASTALVMIDMQRDFVESGGFGASLGNDVSQFSEVVAPAIELLGWARSRRLPVVLTREAHCAHPSDCPPAKRLRGAPSMRIGDSGPMGRILTDGKPGTDFVARLEPLGGEMELVKPGKGAIHATALGVRARLARHHAPRLWQRDHGGLRTDDDARGQRLRIRLPARRGGHRQLPTAVQGGDARGGPRAGRDRGADGAAGRCAAGSTRMRSSAYRAASGEVARAHRRSSRQHPS